MQLMLFLKTKEAYMNLLHPPSTGATPSTVLLIGSYSTHNSAFTHNGILSTPPQTILTLHHQIEGEEGYESM